MSLHTHSMLSELLSWFPPIFLLGWLLLFLRRPRRNARKPPPGPTPLPLLGNLLQIPRDHLWLKFSEWRKEYGDMVHVHALGNHMIILNSLEVMNDLLDRRRGLYSGRPILHMAGELMGTHDTMSFSQPNERWKWYRRISRQILSKPAVKNFMPELRLAVGRIIISATYGFSPHSAEDEYITLAEFCLKEVTEAAIPGAYLVEAIPALKYVPAWFPGAAFKRRAEHARKETIRMVETPVLRVKQELAAGTASKSFVTDILQSMKESPENDYNIKWFAGTLYAGGLETTYATVLVFFSLMLDYPDVQRTAQEEIDNVLCGERLPTFDDLPSLPYCEAVIKEVYRFRPAVRLGIPHAVTEDDVYKDYHIPKMSMIIPNIWEVSRDPTIYQNPEKFWPERFLHKEKPELDPYSYMFGFGNRLCPGRHLATEALHIFIVYILATFNVVHVRDENGQKIIPQIEYTPSLVSVPLPYPCAFEPREKYADILQNVQAEATNGY